MVDNVIQAFPGPATLKGPRTSRPVLISCDTPPSNRVDPSGNLYWVKSHRGTSSVIWNPSRATKLYRSRRQAEGGMVSLERLLFWCHWSGKITANACLASAFQHNPSLFPVGGIWERGNILFPGTVFEEGGDSWPCRRGILCLRLENGRLKESLYDIKGLVGEDDYILVLRQSPG